MTFALCVLKWGTTNLINKNKIMNKQKDSKVAETKPELYTLLCPVELFRYFLSKTYKEVAMSNEECDEIGQGFYKYLQKLELTDEQKKNILPKDTFDVILNAEHPLRTNGFPPAYVFHFTEYVGKQNGVQRFVYVVLRDLSTKLVNRKLTLN